MTERSAKDKSHATKTGQELTQESRTAVPDDRYPGSFFRVPGVPVPGKTTWSLVK